MSKWYPMLHERKHAKDIDKILSDHYQGSSTESNVSEGFSNQHMAPALDGVAHMAGVVYLASLAHLADSPA